MVQGGGTNLQVTPLIYQHPLARARVEHPELAYSWHGVLHTTSKLRQGSGFAHCTQMETRHRILHPVYRFRQGAVTPTHQTQIEIRQGTLHIMYRLRQGTQSCTLCTAWDKAQDSAHYIQVETSHGILHTIHMFTQSPSADVLLPGATEEVSMPWD